MPPSSGKSNPAQSNAFRLISVIVTVLLLTALVVVVWQVIAGDPPSRIQVSATPSPITTTVAPTRESSPESTVSTPMTAGERLPRGGFAFAPHPDFNLTKTDVSATLTGAGDDGALAPVLLLSGGTPSQFVSTDSGGAGVIDASDLGALLDRFVTYFSEEDDFDAGDPTPVLVDGAPALGVDLLSRNPADRFAGRIVMAQPADGQLFVMVGIAPQTRWRNEVAAQYQHVLDSVQLFALGSALDIDQKDAPTTLAEAALQTSTPSSAPGAVKLPTATPLPTASPGPTVLPADAPLPTPPPDFTGKGGVVFLSNANFTNQVALANGNIWAATEGGIAVWNQENGGLVKFTPFDGLATNHFSSVVACPLPGLGIVFGGDNGLQIFDTRTGAWNTLNTGNSTMSFDDVSTLFCDPEHGFLVAGYQQHGLDIFDTSNNRWTHLDRNNGLGANVVKDIAVIGDRKVIWISSGAGVTALVDGGLPDGEAQRYNAANSPLALAPLAGLVADQAGVVWIAGGRQLYRIDGEEWMVYDASSFGDDFPTAALAGLDISPDGTVWLADANAVLCAFDPLSERCLELYRGEPGMLAGSVTSVTVDMDMDTDVNGDVHYSTAGHGVARFDGERWRSYDVPGELLSGNQIRALAQDRSGFVWVVTEKGVQRMNPVEPAAARLYPYGDGSMPLENVRAIAPAAINGVWFGGDNGAAFFDDSQGGEQWTHFTAADGLAGDHVQALAADRQRRTWIGTESGLSIWNGESFFNLTRENGLPSENITALLADEESSVWIGTSNGGLYQFARNQLKIFNMDNAGLLSDTVTALARAADGSILVGSEQGLARFTERQATRIDDVPAVPIASLTTRGDEIWVGAEGDGIRHFDGEEWRQRRNDDGLPSPTITALLIDQYGVLWAGGASGGLVK